MSTRPSIFVPPAFLSLNISVSPLPAYLQFSNSFACPHPPVCLSACLLIFNSASCPPASLPGKHQTRRGPLLPSSKPISAPPPPRPPSASPPVRIFLLFYRKKIVLHDWVDSEFQYRNKKKNCRSYTICVQLRESFTVTHKIFKGS
jgi:hypothetical protein